MYDSCKSLSISKKNFFGDLKVVINSFEVATDSFRQADDLLFALDSQSNSFKLIEKPLKRKKGDDGTLPKRNACRHWQVINRTPQQISCQSQQILTPGLHRQLKKIRNNPIIRFRFIYLMVSQPVITPVPISLPPQMNIKSGVPAQVGPSEIQS